jgi:ApbE superfamily uncharacterized protein (UPF0280 family)
MAAQSSRRPPLLDGLGVSRRAAALFLPDGRRLHLQDGPIDLVVEAFGGPDEIEAAYKGAILTFDGLLDSLCDELPLLRRPVSAESPRPENEVARRMHDAVAPFASRCFITPMAAVAGSVADTVLGAMRREADLRRAYVNNGGDIAIHLEAGETLRLGLIDRPDRRSLFATAVLTAADPIRGVATSGWRGRSFSLGIADAVTVLAGSAAEADAAATVIANAVDLPRHPSVRRVPADSIQPDSDLGSRLVTRAVGHLTAGEIAEALDRGLACAEAWIAQGLVRAAALHLQGVTRVTERSAALRVEACTAIAASRQELLVEHCP